MNLAEELDRSIGEGPALPPPQDLLPSGRRALARRRISVGAAAAAVVVVVVGLTAVGGGLLGDDTSAPAPSNRVSDAADPPAEPPSRAEIRRVIDAGLVEFDGFGDLVISPRADVQQRLDNPYEVAAPRKSVAIAAEIDRAVYWFATVYIGDGISNSVATYGGSHRQGFEAWVADKATIAEDGPDGDSGEWPGIPDLNLVRFAEGDRLEAVAGVTLVRQVAQPDLGAAWAGPNDRSAVAEVVRNGERYYVLARVPVDGPEQYIAVPEADGGPTLEQFIDLAQDRYAEGGGGLL